MEIPFTMHANTSNASHISHHKTVTSFCFSQGKEIDNHRITMIRDSIPFISRNFRDLYHGYKQKVTHLTSVTVVSVIFRLVYLPRPCRNFRDLYSLLSRAEQYLLQIMQKSFRHQGTQIIEREKKRAHRHTDRQ